MWGVNNGRREITKKTPYSHKSSKNDSDSMQAAFLTSQTCRISAGLLRAFSRLIGSVIKIINIL